MRHEYAIHFCGKKNLYFIKNKNRPKHTSWGFKREPLKTAAMAQDYINRLIDWRLRSMVRDYKKRFTSKS